MTIDDLLLLGGYHENDLLVDVLQFLFAALGEGLIFIDLTPAKSPDIHKDRRSADESTLSDRFLARCRQGDYNAVVARVPEVDKPLVLVESDGNYRLYFQKYYYHESRLKRQFIAFGSTATAPFTEKRGQLIQRLYTPDRALRKGFTKAPLTKDECQVAAIEQALISPLTIISGGPGTGKTTVVANLLRCWIDCGISPERMLLAAPTGRAARRMTETLNILLQSISEPTPEDVSLQVVQGQTLHGALGYRHPGQFRYSSNNLLPKDVVIVDEASMVDVILMSQFLSALDPSTTRLVLLGDPDQLPAVAAGSVFARLTTFNNEIAWGSACHVKLEKGYRSGSQLTRLAQQIRQGTFPDHQPEAVETAFFSIPSKPWCRVASAGLKNWPKALKVWAQFYRNAFDETLQGALYHLRQRSVADFSDPDESLLEITAKLLASASMNRILTLVRKGPWGCEEINGFLKPHLAGGLDQAGDPETDLFAGMPVMITRNNHENGLYNGDVGIVAAFKEGYHTLFQSSGRYVALPTGHLAVWEPAMAVTVHKSQGSEYKKVFLVLPDDPSHRLLSREMVYTAVTRAQEQLVIWGDEKILRRAVSQKAIEAVSSLAG